MIFSRLFRVIINADETGVKRGSYTGLILLLLVVNVSINPGYADNSKAQISKGSKNISVPVYTTHTDKHFDDVIEDLLVIIAENNFRLTQHSRIGKTIAKRNNILFPPATVIHFCNLDYARQLLEIAPDYLLRMPCRISIMPNRDKSTTIEVWLLPDDDSRTQKIAKKINTILINIVTFAAS